jgi:hypothetical protein
MKKISFKKLGTFLDMDTLEFVHLIDEVICYKTTIPKIVDENLRDVYITLKSYHGYHLTKHNNIDQLLDLYELEEIFYLDKLGDKVCLDIYEDEKVKEV